MEITRISKQASAYLATEFEREVTKPLTASESVTMALAQFDVTAAQLAELGDGVETLIDDVVSGRFNFQADLSRPAVIASRVAAEVEAAGGVEELKSLLGVSSK